jgi:hypothetical protein
MVEKYDFNKDKRKKFVSLVLAQEKDLDDLMQDTQDDFDNVIERNSRQDKINDKDSVISDTRPVLEDWQIAFSSILLSFGLKTAKVVGSTEVKKVDNYYNNKNFNNSIKQSYTVEYSRLEDKYFTIKNPVDGLSIGDRIKSIRGDFLKTTRDIIEVGIKNNLGAKEIAKQIDNLVNPSEDVKWIGPFDWVRKRFGYEPNKSIDRRAGSISYNSFRIARTEIADTYRRFTIRLHRGQKWIKGFEWQLSAGHPFTDICDDYDGKIFKDETDLPVTHPNCLCNVVPVLAEPDELG